MTMMIICHNCSTENLFEKEGEARCDGCGAWIKFEQKDLDYDSISDDDKLDFS